MANREQQAATERMFADPVAAAIRSANGIAVLDRDLRVLFVNPAMASIARLDVASPIGRLLPELLPVLEDSVRDDALSVVATGQPIEGVLVRRPVSADRRAAEFVISYYPSIGASGEVGGVIVVVSDITAATLLAESVSRHARRSELLADFHGAVAGVLDEREIFKIAAERLVALDLDTCVISVRSDDGRYMEPVVVAAGREEDAAFGRDVLEHGRQPVETGLDAEVMRTSLPVFEADATPETAARLLASLPAAQRGRDRDFAIRSVICVPLRIGGDVIGAIRLVRIGKDRRPLQGDDLEFVHALADRVALAAERSRNHRALAETAATLGAVLRESPLATAVLDPFDRVVIWNAAAERLFGYSEDEVVGREMPFEASSPNEVAAIKRRLAAGEIVAGVETTRIRKDGTQLDVAVYASPFFDAQGLKANVIRFADIGPRKQLEAELLQSQKIESIGRLAGGVAHDFNNILTAMIGYADLGLADLAENGIEDALRDLESIKVAGERAAGLTQQLLAFSRRQVLVPEVVDANAIVMGTESMLRRLIGEHIDLRIVLDANAGSLKADPTHLQQVILNLVLNARDAMPAGGELRIATGRTRFDATVASQHLELVPGEYVMISVCDTGTGMDANTKARIFEPFFTTKERGKGTGLGLATTYGIVRQSEGHIWVSSEVGHGTEFTLYFPAAVPEFAPDEVAPPLPAGRSGRILLVEDEPALRELARIVLMRQGYSLIVAANAADALATLEAQPSLSVDLLVTDVVMPGMSGAELARLLRATSPGLRVLLVSGYSDDTVSQAGPVSDAAFLAKPFTPDGLLRKVAEVLGPSAPLARVS